MKPAGRTILVRSVRCASSFVSLTRSGVPSCIDRRTWVTDWWPLPFPSSLLDPPTSNRKQPPTHIGARSNMSAPTDAFLPWPRGASGPTDPINVAEFERHARTHLQKQVYDYFKSGAHDEISLRDNMAAFERLVVRPRVLVDVSKLDLSTTVLGHRISSPICIAPTAMQKMAHPDGELATAKGQNKRCTSQRGSCVPDCSFL